MILKLLGAVIFLGGAATLGLGYRGFNLMDFLPFSLPEAMETYAPYIAMVVGAVLFFMGGGNDRPQRF